MWAVGRLGVAACLACIAAVDRQAQHSCLVCCQLSRPDKCVLRRSATGGHSGSACTTRHTPTLNTIVRPVCLLNSHRHNRHDKTIVSVSCRARRCELDNCSERVQTSNFLSATVLSCGESNSHHQNERNTDKTVLSCLVWQCELALRQYVSVSTRETKTRQYNICTYVMHTISCRSRM